MCEHPGPGFLGRRNQRSEGGELGFPLSRHWPGTFQGHPKPFRPNKPCSTARSVPDCIDRPIWRETQMQAIVAGPSHTTTKESERLGLY